MSDFKHLLPAAATMMGQPTSERILFCQQDIWIDYPRSQQVLGALEDLLSRPKTLRSTNILLVGDSGNGKSSIVERFWKTHNAFCNSAGDPVVPVVFSEMPSEPSETRFWSSVLDSMCIAHRPNENVQRKEAQAFSILTSCQTRVLIIDEIHNLLFGHARQQRQFLGVLKNLSNRLKIPIIAVGTREAIRALHTDPQLSSRFEPIGLQRWGINRDFVNLLASFEQIMPLAEPSYLASKEITMKIHALSGGTIGGVSGVIRKAAVHAIRSGKERIDLNCLKEIEWVRLSDYGKSAERL